MFRDSKEVRARTTATRLVEWAEKHPDVVQWSKRWCQLLPDSHGKKQPMLSEHWL